MIGDVITAALPILRANAESLMTDTCTIDRETSSWDEDEQETVTTWEAVVTTPCHFDPSGAAAQAVISAEAGSLENPVVTVPHTVTGIQPDDRVTVAGQPAPLWVTRAAPEDATHPVEVVIQCRWVR